MSLLHYQQPARWLSKKPNNFRDLWDFGNMEFMDEALKVDVKENKDAFWVIADVPGVKAEDINVEVDKNVLTIEAARQTIQEEDKENYHYSERATGSFRRQFSLSREIDSENIKATLNNGVLNLVLPKGGNHCKKIAIEQQD